ncbi:MAG: hypothetical protein ACK2UK_08025 [Candidatus Promineifilaceae bacterium]
MTQTTELNPILDAQFRANPAYSLVLFDHLSPARQDQLRSMAEDEAFYGVLQPAANGNGAAKAVDQETALLFLTLREPGPVPHYIRRKFGRDCPQAIAELVLEGVLQIRQSESQEFQSGGNAHPLLFQKNGRSSNHNSAVVLLSYDALDYAQKLPGVTARDLTMRLYRYNTVPLSPARRAAWAAGKSTDHISGIDEDGPARQFLSAHWQKSTGSDEENGWLSWHKKDRSRSSWLQSQAPFKLYISPLPEALPDAWPDILEQLTHSDALSFKVGKGLLGLLRPDKIVAYLPDFASLSSAAEGLREALGECPAQGVPFSAPIDRKGLISWGMDPQEHDTSFGKNSQESWRTWVTGQLAGAIVEARDSGAGIEAREFALDRLRLQGVDTETWVLQQSIWQKTGGSDHVYA